MSAKTVLNNETALFVAIRRLENEFPELLVGAPRDCLAELLVERHTFGPGLISWLLREMIADNFFALA